MNVRFLTVLILLAFASHDVTAGDPPSNDEPLNEAWQANVSIGGNQYTSTYVFLTHGVMVELQTKAGQRPSISTAFYKIEGQTLSVEWTKLKDNQLVLTSKEQGDVRRVAKDRLQYEIRKHSDARQVGLKIDFRRVKINQQEYAAMLQLADTYHRLKVKQIQDKNRLDYYRKQLSDYENGIRALIKQ